MIQHSTYYHFSQNSFLFLILPTCSKTLVKTSVSAPICPDSADKVAQAPHKNLLPWQTNIICIIVNFSLLPGQDAPARPAGASLY